MFLATEFIYIEDGEIIDIQSIKDDIKIWQWIGRIRVIKSKNNVDPESRTLNKKALKND